MYSHPHQEKAAPDFGHDLVIYSSKNSSGKSCAGLPPKSDATKNKHRRWTLLQSIDIWQLWVSQRDQPKASQGTGFPLPGEKPAWPGNAPLEASYGLQVSKCAKRQFALKQFSVFSFLCFAQHLKALKPEENCEKGSECFLSNPLCNPPVPHPFLIIASLQKRDFRSIIGCWKGESQPCKLLT